MKFLFLVANWKSYKTKAEALEWVSAVHNASFNVINFANKEVILCPPFPLLNPIHEYMLELGSNDKLVLRLGSQNISPFDEGAYTGEVSGRVLQEFCAYSIIGHSERRQYFNETDELLEKKVNIAKQFNITPVFCIQGKETVIPKGISIVAYEPVWAIGSGKPDTPEDANAVAQFTKEQHGVNYVLYGGSVTFDNVKSFTSMEYIDGVLVGGASRDADNFIQIVKNA